MDYPVFDHNGMTIDGESGKDVLLKAYKNDLAVAVHQRRLYADQAKSWQSLADEYLSLADSFEKDSFVFCKRASHYKRRCDELRKNNWRLGKSRDRLNAENIKLREKVIPTIIAVSLVAGAAWSWSLPFIHHFFFGK